MNAKLQLLRALMMPEGYADGGVVGGVNSLFQPGFVPAGGEGGGMYGASDPEGGPMGMGSAYGAPTGPNGSTWGAADRAAATSGLNSPEAQAAAAAAMSSAQAMNDAVNSPAGRAIGMATGLGKISGMFGPVSSLAASSRGRTMGQNYSTIGDMLSDLFGFSPDTYGMEAGPGTNDSNPGGFNAARGLAAALDAMGLADRETQNALDAAGRARDPVGFGPHDVGPGGPGRDSGPDVSPGREGGGEPLADGGPVWPSGGVNWQSPQLDRIDNVPARLTPGEFVMDRPAIRGAGGGDLNSGIALMQGLQQLFRMLNQRQTGNAPAGVI